MKQRVVITALGVISSLGDSIDEIVSRMRDGQVRFSRADFDPKAAICPVPDFEIKKYTGRDKNLRYLNRGAGFGVAAAMNAAAVSGLEPSELSRAGLFCAAGPNFDIGNEIGNIREGTLEEKPLAALWMLRFLPNTTASVISRLAKIHGENLTVCTACAASMQAIGEAFRKVRDGYVPLALAGGSDSRLNPGGILAYKRAQALWSGPHDPQANYHIFDVKHQGFIPGEGGAFFLLESLDHAAGRGAPILAEIIGYGASMTGNAMTAPDPDGKWEMAAVENAMKDACISPGDIDLVSAHGTGTPLNDNMEADLIGGLCHGGFSGNVIALKSWIGHLASACGAVELAICLGLIKNDFLPAIRNLTEPCRSNIGFVTQNKSACSSTLLLENFGFGGQNAALVVKKWSS